MTVKENLIAAKALIDTPEKWCQGGPGEVRGGQHTVCAYIAVGYAAYFGAHDVYRALYRALPWWFRLTAPRWDQKALIWFNDRRQTTHADIMALFDRAIAAAE